MDQENDRFVVPFFRRSELACRCGCDGHPKYTERQMAFLREVSGFRRDVDSPLLVTSYVRCPKNAWWWDGTRHDLEHGDAIDLRSMRLNPVELLRIALRIPMFTGFGINKKKNFLHLDAKPGRFAIWEYTDTSYVVLVRQVL